MQINAREFQEVSFSHAGSFDFEMTTNSQVRDVLVRVFVRSFSCNNGRPPSLTGRSVLV